MSCRWGTVGCLAAWLPGWGGWVAAEGWPKALCCFIHIFSVKKTSEKKLATHGVMKLLTSFDGGDIHQDSRVWS